jgi:hypothetical protein
MTSSDQDFGELAGSLAALARRAAAEYAILVDHLVVCRSCDAREIERTLDGLLDFCFDPEVLQLFRRLCRHYYGIDPSAAADYVAAYREMWDSEQSR